MKLKSPHFNERTMHPPPQIIMARPLNHDSHTPPPRKPHPNHHILHTPRINHKHRIPSSVGSGKQLSLFQLLLIVLTGFSVCQGLLSHPAWMDGQMAGL
jgi:hypothetical protein